MARMPPSATEPLHFEELLAGARLGEASALAELWARYSPRIAGFVRARGAVDVDEVTSDVFLATFRTIGTFVGDETGFVALLHTIARRRSIDELRQRSRRLTQTAWWPSDDDRVIPSVEDVVIGSQDRHELLALVERLTPRQRDVVLLRLVADLSIAQVAQVLGTSQGTVKSLQRRGLDALRRMLAGRAEGAGPDHTGRPGPRDRSTAP